MFPGRSGAIESVFARRHGPGSIAGLMFFLIVLIGAVAPLVSHAALIQRAITVNGDVADWTSPVDITSNPGQFSEDGDGRSCPSTDLDTGSPCSALTPGGRDLRTFAFTWDSTSLYIFVQRWGGTSNVTEWWFYMDADADGVMETGEPVLRVSWQGSNRNTDRYLYIYTAVAAGGDLLVNPVADGYTMPGSITLDRTLASASGGSADQYSMESWVDWADIGLAAPGTVNFHISSSNNASSMPSSVIDNMDGPAGSSIAISPDIVITKSALTTNDPVNAGSNPKAIPGATVLYSIVLSNQGAGATDSDSVVVTDAIPANTELYAGDLGGGPIVFINSSSGLTYTYNTLGDGSDDLSFSSDGGTSWNYTPAPDVDGYDSAVTNIRVNPKGVLAASDGTSNPGFQLRFQVRVR